MPQAELATKMRNRGYAWSQNTVWQVENGKRPLRFSEAVSLAEVFQADISLLSAPPEESLLVQELSATARELDESFREALFALTALKEHRNNYESALKEAQAHSLLSDDDLQVRLEMLKQRSFRTLIYHMGLLEAPEDYVFTKTENDLGVVHTATGRTTTDVVREFLGVEFVSEED